MLEYIQMNSPSDRLLALRAFEPNHSTWVVADLRLKLEIQQHVLSQQGYFADESILRVSELWKTILKRLFPDFHIRSVESIKIILSEWLENEELSFKDNVDDTVMKVMDLMHPLYVHQQNSSVGHEQMRSWLYENTDSLQRWGGWYVLAEKYFQQFLQKKIISPRWMAGFLQSQLSLEVGWSRPLIFDLGSQLSQTEADLILMLSRFLDVKVLAPRLDLSHRFEYLLKPYAFLRDQAFAHSSLSVNGIAPQFYAMKHSGILSECKSAVAQLRKWFEQGIDLKKMAIIAPDIEQYWPVLEPLLQHEGLPVNKSTVFKIQQLPAIQNWLSHLKIRQRQFDFSDLENANFNQEQPNLRYEKFYALFSQMLEASDLARNEEIQKSFFSDNTPSGLISLEQAIGWMLKFWNAKNSLEPLEEIFRDLFTHADRDLKLKLSSWLQWVQIIAAKKEITLRPADLSGVQIANLQAADSVYVTERIFLGNAVSQMTSNQSSLLTPKEIASIASQIGFYLEHPDVSNIEFDLTWLSQWQNTSSDKNTNEMHFYFPHTGFSGEAESPIQKWAELAKNHLKENTHLSPAWDAKINQTLALSFDHKNQISINSSQSFSHSSPQNSSQDSSKSSPKGSLQLTAFTETDSFKEKNEVSIKYESKRVFSPSALESYRECAFIYLSQRMFKLQDHPLMDLDIDARTSGILLHAVFEKIMIEPRRFDWSETELRSLIDSLRQAVELDKIDDFIWTGMREKYIKMCLRTLVFEKTWQTHYPQSRVWSAEKNFNVEMKSIPIAHGTWNLRGKIDRMDWDQKNKFVIVDYKGSANGDLTNFKAWIKKNQLQLALYVFAAEQFLPAEFSEAQVVGAFYYFVRQLERNKGLALASDLPFFEIKANATTTVSEKNELMLQISEIVSGLVNNIIQGQFTPNPLNPKDCDSCQWRKLCRAPHLNW